MKNIYNMLKWGVSLLLAGILLFQTGCQDELLFEDHVPDYTYSIIRNFTVNDQAADIDHTNGAITATLPAGSDLSSVAVEISLPDGATVSPESGSTVDFSKGPVIFTVSNNGVFREYTATISVYGNPLIMSFSIGENMGEIDQENGVINVTVGSQEDITNLVPQFTIPAGTTATPASGVAQNFSNPVKYTIVSNDGFTGKSYFVHVTQIEAPAITRFSVDGIAGTILEENQTIILLLPPSYDLSNITPTIEVPAGQSVSPASGVPQDFSGGPVSYTVTNTEGLTKAYEVSISLGSSNIAFIGDGDDVNSIVDDDAKAAALYLRTTYPDAFNYIKFSDITAEALEDIKVVMLYYLTPLPNQGYSAAPDNVLSMLPAELQPGTTQSNALAAWVKAGGHMFIAGDPTPFIHVLGRIPGDYSAGPFPGNYLYTEFGCAGPEGCVDMNVGPDDIWGLSAKVANTSEDRRSHPIYSGLTFNGDGELPLYNGATREARLVWWQHFDNTMDGYTCCGTEGVLLMEQTFNAIKLGTLRWIGDGFGVGAIEYLPTDGDVAGNFDFNIPTTFQGHIISLENTIIGYEFDPNDTTNDYHSNIEKLTANIIDYLRTL
ncbi:MAG: DUF4960 domain-containing protein [Lewinellaceae bacterium]|nr:DUF4960 domain-containing protein [Lewinellaceae bacterium]